MNSTYSPDDAELLAATLRTIRAERARIRTLHGAAHTEAVTRITQTFCELLDNMRDMVTTAAARTPFAQSLPNADFHFALAAPWYALFSIAHDGRAIRSRDLFRRLRGLARQKARSCGVDHGHARDLVQLGAKYFIVITSDGLALPIGLPRSVCADLQSAHTEATLNASAQ
ncbi:hypothetical protein [Gemmatimonas sp.]|jgi:hypothetical protein|uniref:hypothetical protein n=1 Tax=Gemmatimonas sp. TaxID=1962908 RepID=UPI003DA2BE90